MVINVTSIFFSNSKESIQWMVNSRVIEKCKKFQSRLFFGLGERDSMLFKVGKCLEDALYLSRNWKSSFKVAFYWIKLNLLSWKVLMCVKTFWRSYKRIKVQGAKGRKGRGGWLENSSGEKLLDEHFGRAIVSHACPF